MTERNKPSIKIFSEYIFAEDIWTKYKDRANRDSKKAEREESLRKFFKSFILRYSFLSIGSIHANVEYFKRALMLPYHVVTRQKPWENETNE